MTVACVKVCGGCCSWSEQIVHAVADPLRDLFQRTVVSSKAKAPGLAWERISVRKIDQKGEFYKYRAHGVVTKKDALFSFVVHNPSGTLYKDEDQMTVAFKCFLLAMGNPLFAAAKSIWSLGKVVVGVAIVAIRCFAQIVSHAKEESAFSTLKRHVLQISDLATQNMYRAFTAPLYALGVEVGALVGIFFPYEGRRIVARVESLSQEGQGIKQASCLLDDIKGGELRSLDDLAEAFLRREVCFLAFCFQPRGSLKEEPDKYCIEERKPVSFSPSR